MSCAVVKSGFDGGKLVTGRKRPIVVDTIGCVLVVRVHAANVFDGKAARQVITNLFRASIPSKKSGAIVPIPVRTYLTGS